MTRRWLPTFLVLAAALAGCAKTLGPGALERGGLGMRAKNDDKGGAVMVGAGDIAYDSPGAEQTAKLLDKIPGTVFALGDNAYQEGTPEQFAKYYHPTWGRHKARTRPAIGNHEYRTAGAAGYFGYFGELAGRAGEGWYAYDVDAHWRAVVVNSNDDQVGVGPGSPQYVWAQGELAAAKAAGKNVITYWHHPRWSSGAHGDNKPMQAMWELMVAEGADLALWGHDHHYERFKPANGQGDHDPKNGMTSFVVGTGGKNHYPLFKFPKKITATRNGSTFGVIKLSLRPTDFEWEFVPVAGEKYTDRGAAPVR